MHRFPLSQLRQFQTSRYYRILCILQTYMYYSHTIHVSFSPPSSLLVVGLVLAVVLFVQPALHHQHARAYVQPLWPFSKFVSKHQFSKGQWGSVEYNRTQTLTLADSYRLYVFISTILPVSPLIPQELSPTACLA